MASLDWARLRVLVVDDNAYFRKVVRTVLTAVGVTRVAEAADADEAMRLLRAGSRDLILVDYVMSPVDGLTFTRRVRDPATSPAPRVPIVLVSGHISPPEVQEALNVGVDAVVGKPISARVLLREIKRTLTDSGDPDGEGAGGGGS
ncbi:response regulator [Roseospira visakhapatnamensis]|uniref:CheY-like chemotaxis protein n=1 Tax=Roseospira visakhapatnamensis TaxID=390880 RepID=A0A7W6RF61_9PROT|nr:response regulator [Roseospira visakhapatnamensis]MBB4267307.1 CheY-like chemotaxis protein [Roseospira visakhapatnamensis]